MKSTASRKPHPRADELRELKRTATRARAECDAFDSEFSRKHLQDNRLSRAGLILVDGNARDDSHPGTEDGRVAERQQTRDKFQADSRRREELRRAAQEAERRVRELENAIAEEIDEAKDRTELAAAVKLLGEETATVMKLRDANARARDAVEIAETRAHDAAAAVNAAVEYVDRMFAAAIEQGHAADRDASVREARAAATAAEDDLAIARRAEDTMRVKLADAETNLSEIQETVQRLSGRILASGLPALLEAAAAARSDMLAQEAVLHWLAQFAPHEVRRDTEAFLSKPWLWNRGPAEQHPAVAPWLSTRNALMTDADAALPTS